MPRKPKSKLLPTSPPHPYPDHAGPTPDQCRSVRDALLALHGFPAEFARYRRDQPDRPSIDEESETVLDGLVITLLSQNTTDANSRRAFLSLKSAFPTWEQVLVAESRCVENAIRCGGLAATKAARIKSILKGVMEKRGEICLEYLRGLKVDEVKAELSQFKGIGPKTLIHSGIIRRVALDVVIVVDHGLASIMLAHGWHMLVLGLRKTIWWYFCDSSDVCILGLSFSPLARISNAKEARTHDKELEA